MGNTEEILNDLLRRIDAHAEPLAEARTRLRLARTKAGGIPGALRTFASGSIPQNTFIHPVDDGDGGVVLDRRAYPGLDPECGGGPARIMPPICALLASSVREVYPRARCTTSRRGPKIVFGRPVDGQDPTVDMVIALTRRSGTGLWIPDLGTDTWEASDPERHVVLFTSGDRARRRTRRRVIRLLKAWNKQFAEPAFSSHNLCVWAWEFVRPGTGVAVALRTVLTEAAGRVESGAGTPDPVGVSGNVRLLVTPAVAGRRLRGAADALTEALDRDDDRAAVLSALSRVFYRYLDGPAVERRRGPVRCTRACGARGIRR